MTEFECEKIRQIKEYGEIKTRIRVNYNNESGGIQLIVLGDQMIYYQPSRIGKFVEDLNKALIGERLSTLQ